MNRCSIINNFFIALPLWRRHSPYQTSTALICILKNVIFIFIFIIVDMGGGAAWGDVECGHLARASKIVGQDPVICIEQTSNTFFKKMYELFCSMRLSSSGDKEYIGRGKNQLGRSSRPYPRMYRNSISRCVKVERSNRTEQPRNRTYRWR